MQKTFIVLAMLAMFASSAKADIIDTTEPGLFGPGGISSFTSFTFSNGVTADINVVGVDGANGDSLALDLNRAGIGVVNGAVNNTEILQFDFTNVQAPAGFTFVSFEFTAVLSQTRGTGGNGFVFASNDTADAFVDGSLTAFAGSDISGDGVDQGSALLASDDGSPALAGNTFLFADNGGPVPFTTAIGIGNVTGGPRIQAIHVTAIIEPVSDCVLGDVNTDGAVDFLDISPFITALTSGGIQCEADINEDGAVNFLDISPFIAILISAGNP